jgi:8-oxo-dGTP pyrophosphatase MutT (NUDIX family)
MAGREVSIVIFYDENKNIGVQERGAHSKLGEVYGYFGGGVEQGENAAEAMKRELNEELGYVTEELEFWIDHEFYLTEKEYKNWLIRCHVFLSPITEKLLNTKPVEGSRVIKMSIGQALIDKGFYQGDKELLVKLDEELSKRFSSIQ